jgi:hypothetical protein
MSKALGERGLADATSTVQRNHDRAVMARARTRNDGEDRIEARSTLEKRAAPRHLQRDEAVAGRRSLTKGTPAYPLPRRFKGKFAGLNCSGTPVGAGRP